MILSEKNKKNKKTPKRENGLPARLVMALERARAEDTPLPVPDMSSPSSSLENFSFTISASTTHQRKSCFSNKIAIRNRRTGSQRRWSKKDHHLRAGPHAGPAWAAPPATTCSRPPPYPTGRRPAAAEGPPRVVANTNAYGVVTIFK